MLTAEASISQDHQSTNSPDALDSPMTTFEEAPLSVRVPRPRNSFMIFRCEFSQKNKSHEKRIRRPAGPKKKDETLSKRASTAWHQLPEKVKSVYKELARQEEKEHKRRYPSYRFRPVKRGTQGAKRQAARVSKPVPSRVVKHIEPFECPVLDIPVAPVAPVAQMPPPLPLSDGASRRRSASMPSPLTGQHPFMSPLWATQPPTLTMKRSKSSLGFKKDAEPMTSTLSSDVEQFLDPQMFEAPPPRYCTPDEQFGAVGIDTLGASQYHILNPSSPGRPSPYITSSCSSLSSWDGGDETNVSEIPSNWTSSPIPFQSYMESLYLPCVALDDRTTTTPVYDSGAVPVPVQSQHCAVRAQEDCSDSRALVAPPFLYYPYASIAEDNYGVVWTHPDQTGTAEEPFFSYDTHLANFNGCQF